MRMPDSELIDALHTNGANMASGVLVFRAEGGPGFRL